MMRHRAQNIRVPYKLCAFLCDCMCLWSVLICGSVNCSAVSDIERLTQELLRLVLKLSQRHLLCKKRKTKPKTTNKQKIRERENIVWVFVWWRVFKYQLGKFAREPWFDELCENKSSNNIGDLESPLIYIYIYIYKYIYIYILLHRLLWQLTIFWSSESETQ